MIAICEVGPRDGLQNEAVRLPVAARVDLIHRLAAAGIRRIEAVSFVNPKRVPQMDGAEEVVAEIVRRSDTSYSGLVLNETGYNRLATTALDAVHVVLIATETFSLRNANRSLNSAVGEVRRIVARAKGDGRFVSATISAAFGCPFEGRVDPMRIAEFGRLLVAEGCDELVLADTIGVAVPRQVKRLLDETRALGVPLGVHFHNTRNTGFANAYAALESGATVFDSSIGGLGGCPFAPRATGNIATEDLINMLVGEGIDLGVDLEGLIEISTWLEGLLAHQLEGHVYRAGVFNPSYQSD